MTEIETSVEVEDITEGERDRIEEAVKDDGGDA